MLFFQNSFIYQPTNSNFSNCDNFKNFEKIKLKNDTNFYFLENKNSNKTVVIFHGNYGSSCKRAFINTNFLNKSKYSIIFFEYPGYSKGDKTKTNFKSINNSISILINFLNNNFENPNSFLVFGESIGTFYATKFSTQINLEKLMLISPFDKFENIIKNSFPFFLFPINLIIKDNLNEIQELLKIKNKTKIKIIHGVKDNLINIKLSKNLKKIYPKINHISIENYSHNNMYSSYKVRIEIKNFFE